VLFVEVEVVVSSLMVIVVSWMGGLGLVGFEGIS